MYHIFYGMNRRPFENSIELDMHYSSPQHEAAWIFLINGINSREQYILVVGEYGMGKSTLALRLERLLKLNEKVLCKMVPNPNYSYASIVKLIASAFIPEEIAGCEDIEKIHDSLIRYLDQTDNVKPLYVIFDDVHEVDNIATLPRILSLSRLATKGKSVINWVFFAHPSFMNILKSSQLQALDQRIRHRFVLEPLSLFHTKEYIYFRLYRSGAMGAPRFEPEAIEEIHRHSRGIPRLINNICNRALEIAASMKSMVIDRAIVEKALASIATYSWSPEIFPALGASESVGQVHIPEARHIEKTIMPESSPKETPKFGEAAALKPELLIDEKSQEVVEDSEAKEIKKQTDVKSSIRKFYAYLLLAILLVLILIALRVFHVI